MIFSTSKASPVQVSLYDLAKDLYDRQEWELAGLSEGHPDTGMLDSMAAAGAALLASILVEQGVIEDRAGRNLLDNLKAFGYALPGQTAQPLEDLLAAAASTN